MAHDGAVFNKAIACNTFLAMQSLKTDDWGKGYPTEAAQSMVRFGFTTLRLHRIWSWYVAENRGSAHVLEKLGMRLEGRLQENEYLKVVGGILCCLGCWNLSGSISNKIKPMQLALRWQEFFPT